MFGSKSKEAEPQGSTSSQETELPLIAEKYASYSVEKSGEADQQARRELLDKMAGPTGVISTAAAQEASDKLRHSGESTNIPVSGNSDASPVTVRIGENN